MPGQCRPTNEDKLFVVIKTFATEYSDCNRNECGSTGVFKMAETGEENNFIPHVVWFRTFLYIASASHWRAAAYVMRWARFGRLATDRPSRQNGPERQANNVK